MPVRPLTAGFTVLVLVALAACGKPDSSVDTSKDRSELDALERRLAELDKRLSAVEKTVPATESLRSDVRALEQRLASSEAKAAQALETAKGAPVPPPPSAASPGGSPAAAPPSPTLSPHAPAAALHGQPPDAAQRREQLEALATEYYRKRDELVAEHENEGRLEQRAARQALRRWFIDRRRAIVRGEPLPD